MNYANDQKPINSLRLTGMRKKILSLLQQGLHLSELDGLQYGYGTSFRTRVSELRAMGYKIKDHFVTPENGARFKRYYLESERAA